MIMTKMKKLMSVLLAAAMAMSLTVPAIATNENKLQSQNAYTLPNGVTKVVSQNGQIVRSLSKDDVESSQDDSTTILELKELGFSDYLLKILTHSYLKNMQTQNISQL